MATPSRPVGAAHPTPQEQQQAQTPQGDAAKKPDLGPQGYNKPEGHVGPHRSDPDYGRTGNPSEPQVAKETTEKKE